MNAAPKIEVLGDIRIFQDKNEKEGGHGGGWVGLVRREYRRGDVRRGYEVAVRCKGEKWDPADATLHPVKEKVGKIVACLPVTRDGNAVFITQYRIPLMRDVTELVAGLVEDDETPETAVKREVSEEAGLTVGSLSKVATFPTSSGLTDELITTFVADGCEIDPTAKGSGEAAEQIERHLVPVKDAWDWLATRAATGIVDPKTFAVLAWYLRGERA